jgi:hypothetical protein
MSGRAQNVLGQALDLTDHRMRMPTMPGSQKSNDVSAT